MQNPNINANLNGSTTYAALPGIGYTQTAPNVSIGDLLSQLNAINLQLKLVLAENAELKAQICSLTNKTPKSSPVKTSYKSPTWDEENEMVADETAWITRENRKKKRKRNESVSPTKKTNTAQPKQMKRTIDKPPPIIVKIEKEVAPIMDLLNRFGIEFNSIRLNDYQLKINVADSDHYRLVTSQLYEHQFQFHSYENKQTRPIRVMARNIHQSCSEREVFENLAQQGYKIHSVSQKLKVTKTNEGTERKPLPLYMLTFQPDEDVKRIHEIKFICNMKVSIENLRKNKLIPQCKKCQLFGHTQKYCYNAFKCVKCGNPHETAHCKKEKSAPPRCCNCGEAHPANYRGCCVAKKLQEMRDKKNGSNNNKNHHNKNAMNKPTTGENKLTVEPTTSQPSGNATYAEVAKNTSPKKAANNENITEILTLLLSKMNKMEQKISEMEKHHTKTTNNSNKNGRK